MPSHRQPSTTFAPVLSREALLGEIAARRRVGQTVAWTNGCFDILHVGHVRYLAEAKTHADALIVGLNSDASVRAIKGPSRPIIPEAERAEIVAALRFVDIVTVFPELNTVELLDALRPDVYVKGGDYTLDTINQEERRFVESYGGRIAIATGTEDRSSSNLIRSIQAPKSNAQS